jgi:hypothetical protein
MRQLRLFPMLAMATLVGMGSAIQAKPMAPSVPSNSRYTRKRVSFASSKKHTGIDLRPAAEAKRLRKRTKRLFERDAPTWPDLMFGYRSKGKGGHGRNRINVHKKGFR